MKLITWNVTIGGKEARPDQHCFWKPKQHGVPLLSCFTMVSRALGACGNSSLNPCLNTEVVWPAQPYFDIHRDRMLVSA